MFRVLGVYNFAPQLKKTSCTRCKGLKKLKSVTKSNLPKIHLPIPTHLRLQDWSHLELMLQTLFCLKHQIGNNCYFLTHFSNSFYFSWGFLQLVCSWSKNVSNMHLQSTDLWKEKKWNDFKKFYIVWMTKFNLIKVWTVTTIVDAMEWLDTLGTDFTHQLFSNQNVKKSLIQFVVGFFRI